MAIGKTVSTLDVEQIDGGCNYSPDLTSLAENQSPNAMNVEYVYGAWRKRGGCEALNGSVGSGAAGYSIIDFGLTSNVYKQVVHFGSSVYATTNLSGTLSTIRAATPRTKSYNAKVKALMIQTYADYSAPYYWDGALASMAVLSAGQPQFKRVLEFQGYALCMNTSAAKLRIYYPDANSLIGGTFDDYFTLAPAPQDDEITEPFMLNGRCYVGTRTSIFRISYVAGTIVFEYKQVISDTGIVEGTLQIVTTKDFGQVAMFLSTDGRVYLFDGANVKDISTAFYTRNAETEISLDLASEEYVDNAFAVYDSRTKVYRLFITRRGDEKNNFAINIDADTLAMYPFKNMKYASGAMCRDAKGQVFLIGATYTGTLDKLFIDVNTDNGTAIDDYWESAPLTAKPTAIKQGQNLLMQFIPSAKNALTVQDRTDFATRWQARTRISQLDSRDRPLGSFILGQSPLGSAKRILTQMVNIPVSFNFYQFRVSSNSSTQRRWTMLRYSLDQTALAIGRAEAQR